MHLLVLVSTVCGRQKFVSAGLPVSVDDCGVYESCFGVYGMGMFCAWSVY